ncbi:MAG: histidine phosphatase family protein [Nanoarchaeota archaeon]
MKRYSLISPSKNKYFLVRHTECISNIKKISSYGWEKEDVLTETGIEQAKKLGNKLKDYKIDLVFCSPFTRTRQTFEIINKKLKIDYKKIFFDKRLIENNFGIADEKHYDEYHKLFVSEEAYFETPVPLGENYADVKKRANNFLSEVESKYRNKKILIISHGFTLRMIELVAMNLSIKECIEHLRDSHFVQREEIRPLKFPKK